MTSSGEFQDIESNYSGRLSHVSSQPEMIPSSGALHSRDKRLRLDTWNQSGVEESVFLEIPLPMIDESDDGPEDLMPLSHQVLFDTGAARSVCPSTFRTDIPTEPSEEIPVHQADGTRVAHFGSQFFSMGVGIQKIEGWFDARNVTKPIVAAGQVTDRGQGVWLNGGGGFILDVKSARTWFH